jgi:hypothetical protein
MIDLHFVPSPDGHNRFPHDIQGRPFVAPQA